MIRIINDTKEDVTKLLRHIFVTSQILDKKTAPRILRERLWCCLFGWIYCLTKPSFSKSTAASLNFNGFGSFAGKRFGARLCNSFQSIV